MRKLAPVVGVLLCTAVWSLTSTSAYKTFTREILASPFPVID